MTTSLHFRKATPDDASSIQRLVEGAFRTYDTRPEWTGNAELASAFRLDESEVKAKIENPDVVTLMGLDSSNALVASIEVSKRGAEVGRLSMIAVDDRYQRGGVGKQVLAYAEDYCRAAWGVKMFSLNALSTREALMAWYMRRGYSKTGETSPFPRERFPGMELPDDMCFVEMEKVFADEGNA
ncbi:hypothetical protein QQS21_006223 [Conoideocrella luteorostrata]|uniref:N-acetyltransferase domain-containing protein n=1 Tax=Conoideocrella luteorostrata TaxID=1105319 RepID=A0AAJ0CQZ4_9HYPO|nr:hypothetical protein QQS21_006223 [Conoideocrella luteorostrata]